MGKVSVKCDWYVWCDFVLDGGLLNNWKFFFGGLVWMLDEVSGQYYLYQFLFLQLDFNWCNFDVWVVMFDVLWFWMCWGVDGFWVDVIWLLVEDEWFLDELENFDVDCEVVGGQIEYSMLLYIYMQDQFEMYDYVCEMCWVIDEFDDWMMVGEIYLLFDKLLFYFGMFEVLMVYLLFNFYLILLLWDV